MSLERNTDQIKGHFLSNVLFKALPGGLTDFLVVSSLYMFCMEFRVSETDVSTSCTIILAIVGLMILYQIASPMTKYHWILWFGMAAGLLYCMIFVSQYFCDHECIEAEYDAADRVCNRHGADLPLFKYPGSGSCLSGILQHRLRQTQNIRRTKKSADSMKAHSEICS